jgi:flagellar hook-associated protein 1
MPGLSGIFEIARRALASQRAGINTTSHNIANASTPGYSRQRADLSPTQPLRTAQGLMGTGVTVAHFSRIRDRFIDRQIRASSDSLGSASSQHQLLSQVETAFHEPSDTGLNALMTKFFNSFQDLSSHPEETGPRNAIVQQGTLLTQTFRTLNTRLADLRGSQVEDLDMKVSRINQLARDISAIDIEITNARAVGLTPNEALDNRDAMLEELSGLVPVSVSEDAQGSMMVSVGGVVIASRGGAVELTSHLVGSSIQIETQTGGLVVPITSGELGGLMHSYNTTIPGYQTQLDAMASTLIQRVNAIHAAGYGLGNPPSTGVNFFSGTDAASIGVDPAVAANINLIAASANGAPGNNEVALALAGVAREPLLNGNSQTLLQYYNGLVSNIGTTMTALDNSAEASTLMLEQLETQRTAVSGVSLDEEMTNMIQYQRAFDAAARIVNTVDEMFQTILTMRGS